MLFPVVTIMAVSFVPGCASFVIPALDSTVPAAWRSQPTAPRLPAAPAPELSRWWAVFGDPVLDSVIHEALRGSLDLREARLRLTAARALEKAELAQFRPALMFSANAQPYPPANASYFEAGFDAEWELGLFGRHENTRQLAQSTLEDAALQLDAAEVSLVAEVVRSYIRLRTTQHRIALLEAISASERELLEIVQKRRSLGLASELDVSQRERGHADTLAEIDGAREQLESGLLELAYLLGRESPDESWRSYAPIPVLAPHQFSYVPADLLRTRPEIRAAENKVLIAASQLGLAKADRFPRLSLEGFVGVSSRLDGLALAGATNSAYVGPRIEIPLIDWGKRKDVVEARDAELSAALVAYRNAILQGVSEVERSLSALQYRRQTVAHRDQSVIEEEHAVEAAGKLRDLELQDRYAVAEARETRARAEMALDEARYDEAVALISLYKALGGAPPPDDTVHT